MLTIEEAKAKANEYLKQRECEVHDIYGEVGGKYIITYKSNAGYFPAGGYDLTVNKETGECKFERLERESLAPFAKIKGYKKLE